ncbi:uncharacterized protein RHIMIDRAFT_26993 [Rhizopus microsporus ATCC 52813]|uniref:Uncharacterized protein n=1 Tax=Rhizopus microsporus ATCC 52813 TaxID=1340429 RepID=A0A2G4SQ42_RHIZD|nr:uncharacterized protein RHIMIDRAFT_26993 [Rhizopus microsporus ATCC 52813]PHZ10898.1 hypothetical protein RHIMIDRAFT_26993 [Rhizopus microsporus ATCC 52813]
MHLGNRSSNRVEGPHSSLKTALGTSSGKLALVSHKVDLWAAEKVSEIYRANQTYMICTGCMKIKNYTNHDQ